MAHPTDTPDRLRSDIDSGRTGDRIAFPDPSAAPLGTDDEAGGTAPSGRAAGLARKIETGPPGPGARTGPPGGGPAVSDERPRTLSGESEDVPRWMRSPVTMIAAGLAVMAVVVAVVVVL